MPPPVLSRLNLLTTSLICLFIICIRVCMQNRVLNPQELEVQAVGALWCGCCRLNSSLLQGLQGLLATEPFFRPLTTSGHLFAPLVLLFPSSFSRSGKYTCVGYKRSYESGYILLCLFVSENSSEQIKQIVLDTLTSISASNMDSQ